VTVELFPKGNINPAALLARSMQAKPSKVIVISCDDAGDWWASWSTMELRDLAFGIALGQAHIQKIISG